jgi:para-nitrobenzyl esterase
MRLRSLLAAVAIAAVSGMSALGAISDPVETATGRLSGVTLKSGVRVFKGIPFAAPPLVRCAGKSRSRPKNGRAFA